MIRDEYGVANIVSNNGVEVWRIGFAKDNGDGTIGFGGYANNESDPEGGWCFGFFYDHVFDDGDTTDVVYIVHDLLDNGIGNVVGREWTLGDDYTLYTTRDIEFNGKQGDISELGTFNYIAPKILPQMTINVRPPRTDPAGMNELLDLTENNWLSQDCHPYNNADCSGADWDFDGDVDLKDFSYMAQGWTLIM